MSFTSPPRSRQASMRSQNGQILNPSLFLRKMDAGSVPCSTTIKTCKDTLFAFRSTPLRPTAGGVFHLCLRTWPPAARPDLGVPGPFFRSLSLLLADVQTAKSARLNPKKSNLCIVVTTDVFSSIGRHRKNSERKDSIKSAQQAVFFPRRLGVQIP